MENLRKKNETEIQIKIEGHNSRLEQAEKRISELENKIVGDSKMAARGRKQKASLL
jgi:hypothetical protein